jgi:hypothetical protein
VDDSDDDSDDRYSHDGGRLYYEDGEEECEDDDDEDGKARDFRNRKGEKRRHKKEELPELPELLPTYSKIEEEISGVELKREEIIKILEISLYLLLNMPESQIRTRHVTSFYMDILESNFGQMFLESFMTVIRFDETSKNLEHYLRELNSKGGRVEIGLQ